jgi:hypothetical protein
MKTVFAAATGEAIMERAQATPRGARRRSLEPSMVNRRTGKRRIERK